MNRRSARLGLFAVDHQNLADVLHRLGAQALADLRQGGVARFAFHGTGADLDELVRRQRAVDLAENGFGEALLSDVNDRIERVCAAFEGFSFGRRQL
jgi:hypothetical protein